MIKVNMTKTIYYEIVYLLIILDLQFILKSIILGAVPFCLVFVISTTSSSLSLMHSIVACDSDSELSDS